MKRRFTKKRFTKKKLCTLILSGVLALVSIVPSVTVHADGQKVVTLGADLSEEQKQAILRYFGVAGQNLQTITITNQDERAHLGSYVPIEQIGTKTFSCALVNPTSSGGIQVKTANLSWVTSNMIAATLSTSGVVNCEVLAAAPFEVSGTGALTGILMAYESAVGATLESSKKEIATQELITTTQIADSIGQVQATDIINESKIQVIQGEVVNTGDIETIINDVAEEEQISLSEADRSMLVELMQQIADQQYDFEEMQETLERVESNMETLEEQIQEEDPVEDSSDEIYTLAGTNSEMDAPEMDAPEMNTPEMDPPKTDTLSEDSILMNTDDSALGESVIFDATDDSALDEDVNVYDPALDDYEESEDTFEITTDDEYSSDLSEDVTILDDDSEEDIWTEQPADNEPMDPPVDAPTDNEFIDPPVDMPADNELMDPPVDGSADVPENTPTDSPEDTTMESPEEGAVPSDDAVLSENPDLDAGIDTLELIQLPLSDFIFEPITSEATAYELSPAGTNELFIKFQRADIIAGSGSLTLYNAADSSLLETIAMADEQKVAIEPLDQEELTELGWTDGYQAVISLAEPMAQNTAYFVNLSDDALATQDGSGYSEPILDGYTWVIQTGEYGFSLNKPADGVSVNTSISGQIFIDNTTAVYACIENVDPAMVTFDISEFWANNTLNATFTAAGTVEFQVSFYDEAGNVLQTIPYEVTVKAAE